MNIDRESVIRMAREAGWSQKDIDSLLYIVETIAAATAKEYEERLRFTQERWEIECKSQVEIEREACAKVCYELPWKDMSHIPSNLAFAAAIRARGQA